MTVERRSGARTIAVLLASGASSERTGTAVRLAERLLARGHRVTVFAHDHAVALTAGEGDVASAVGALLRQGVHGGTLDWVVDEQASRRLGVLGAQVAGVVPGDSADLWAFVRDADVVLSAGAC